MSSSKSQANASTTTIAIEAVRVGMFIHLDGGWLSHPFARSRFRITEAQQIATLRSLGLARVRWSPELSEVHDEPGVLPKAAIAPGGLAGPPHSGTAHHPAETVPAKAQVDTATATAAARRSAELAHQHELLAQCEAQFGEAAQAWRHACDALGADPAAAGAAATAVAAAFAEKLATDGDVGIRLLPGAGNDRPAAHALNVTVISMLLARSLGLARAELAELALGALLHDIGKMELPERVRHVEAGSSSAETAAYREHVARGVAAARRMGLADGAQAVIAQHHEHADASGFPQRLGGDRLTLSGRIVAVVNRYDNLCNPPTRTPALTPHEAVAMLFAHGRSRYDAAVLNSFIRMMGVYPAGSLVQLTDDRYALVVGVNSTRPLKPRVLVHEAGLPRSEALLLDLEAEPDLGVRRSLTAAKVPAATLQYLDPRPRVAYFFEPLAAPAVRPRVVCDPVPA
jgi:putative nucleotidyltransferase with HDIG domain